jgi:PST family polysaccharide transporter
MALAIAMAVTGYGYWSLVGLVVAMAAANAVLVWVASGWRPGPPGRGIGVRPLLGFGGSLTAFNFLNYFSRNFDNVLIGAVLGAGPLGLYSKAYNLLLLPIRQINGPLGGVVLPALCRLQSDPERFRHYYLRSLGLIAFITVPIVGFVFADTRNFVLTILGTQWLETVPLFRWLAPAALLGAINVAPGWLCIALNRNNRQLRWALISSPIMIASFAIAVSFGVIAVAAAFSISWSLLFVLFVFMACRQSPVTPLDVARAVAPPLMAASGATAAVLGVADLTATLPSPIALLSHVPVFGAVYIVIWLIFADWKPVVDVLTQLRPRSKGALL